MTKKLLFLLFIFVTSCQSERWTTAEKELVCGSPHVMRVLSVDNPEDYAVLNSISRDIPLSALRGEVYKTLTDKMVATVTDPSQDGVGIAGPQVGISRRIVAVQRFDKPGEPFEVYPNIKIIAMRGEKEPGPEGCLSVPGRRGTVLRSRDIDIRYTSVTSLRDTVETVKGFTAVIFQHECDHLDGIIYTDRLWAEKEAWYYGDSVAPASVDVFYICSTDVVSSKGADGSETFNAVLDSAERDALRKEIDYVQKRIFPDSLNFYSPYYHQVTMNGLFDGAASDHLRKAALEVRDAFDYYMRHWNDGHPYILAGFSQGAMLTVDLLRNMTDEQYSRLVAAYSIGYGLDSADIAEPHIVPAAGAYDKRVCISFNSVSDTSGLWPLVQHNAVTCINPVNWRTDAVPATFEYGSSTLSVSLDTLRHVLLVPDFKAEPSPYWPASCLHHYDLLFYTHSLRKNALDRAYQQN